MNYKRLTDNTERWKMEFSKATVSVGRYISQEGEVYMGVYVHGYANPDDKASTECPYSPTGRCHPYIIDGHEIEAEHAAKFSYRMMNFMTSIYREWER